MSWDNKLCTKQGKSMKSGGIALYVKMKVW